MIQQSYFWAFIWRNSNLKRYKYPNSSVQAIYNSQDIFSSVKFSHSVLSHSLWPHGLQHARLPCPSLTPGVCSNLVFIELMMPSNHLVLWCPLLLPSIFPSIRVFSSELALCVRWPKYWSFSFSISTSNDYSGLIYFRIDSQESSP